MKPRSRQLSATGLGRIPTHIVIVVFVICSALPLALLTTFSIALAEDGIRGEVRDRLEGVAVASAESLDKETQALADVVESFAARSEIANALSASRPGAAAPSAATSSSQSASVLGQHLDQLLVARNGVSVTFITDTQGRLVAGRPDNPANVGRDFSFRDWYRGATSSDATYVSDAFESAAPGAPTVVAIATPIRDGRGDTIGFLGANYGLEAIQNFVGTFAGSQGVELTVTDRRGTVVAAPGQLPPGLTTKSTDPRVQAALQGRQGVQSWKDETGSLVSSYAPAKNLGWAVLADTPKSAAFAPVSRLRTAVLSSAAVLGLVLAAGLTFLALTLRERARVERRLQEQSEETRSILEASADAYVAMDEEGKIVAWSKQAEQTFGWRSDEAIGRKVSETVVPFGYREAFENMLRQYIADGDGSMLGTRIEATAVRKDGKEFPIELVVWAVTSGERMVFSAFCHDITERKQDAAELAAARDRAMEASRLKSEFVANMSHEIRTPMNGIIGMVDLLRRTDLAPDQRDYADTVWRSAEALLDVINDILDFSKIEAGRMELDDVGFDIRNVVEESGELLAGAAQTKGLELATMIDPEVPQTLRGDPGRLRQILLNFLGNAVKFTDEGEVVVRCKVDEVRSERVLVRFEISDTGCGIAEADTKRLFESFSQLDTSSTRRHGGTGLGLAISRRLAELMGGEVGVESEVGVGSTFWFTAELLLPSGSRQRIDAQRESLTLAGMRVLVVDDNATNRMILDRMLASWRMETTLATDGEDAWSKLLDAAEQGQPFALALLDYDMPGMDGLELARRMTEHEVLRSTCRLLLTSSSERGELRANQRGEVNGYLTKPVRQSSLLNLIVESVGASGVEHSRRDDREAELDRSVQVLVVDDNVVNQTVTRVMLEKMGYTVQVASNGREALDAIFDSGRAYEAVLMDCQMPVMDGYEATRELRRRESGNQHLPVIAITAHAMEGDLDKCLEAGMDDYLAKPVSWDSLQAILERQISRREETSSNMLDIEQAGTPLVRSETIDLIGRERLRDAFGSRAIERKIEAADASAFVDSVSAQVAAIDAVVETRPRDADALVITLKRQCEAFEADRLVSLCTELQVAADREDRDAVRDLLSRIAQQLDTAREALGLEKGDDRATE